jgi:hypothetical protein
LGGIASCSSKPLNSVDGGNPGKDGGADQFSVAACQCSVDTEALTVDWACYCALYGNCGETEDQLGCQTGLGTWTRGCAIDEYTVDTAGGPEIWAFDQTGKLVGAQLATDDSVFVCPNNQALQRFELRAGQFRPDSCAGVTSCDCGDAGAGPCQPR